MELFTLRELRGAMGWFRLSKCLATLRVPIIPTALDYFTRLVFACWLPHSAQIGRNVVLGYGGLGIVIHQNSVIGDNVEIGQGVTIGGNARDQGEPNIGNDVYIGCGAKVLGPIKIGRGAIIGANSVVLKDVPENSVVVGIPARTVHEHIDINDYLWHRKQRVHGRKII